MSVVDAADLAESDSVEIGVIAFEPTGVLRDHVLVGLLGQFRRVVPEPDGPEGLGDQLMLLLCKHLFLSFLVEGGGPAPPPGVWSLLVLTSFHLPLLVRLLCLQNARPASMSHLAQIESTLQTQLVSKNLKTDTWSCFREFGHAKELAQVSSV